MDNFFPTKVSWCKHCKQGWNEILIEIETGEYFVICSECENSYKTIEDCINNNKPKLYSGGKCRVPDILELEEMGLEKYIIK